MSRFLGRYAGIVFAVALAGAGLFAGCAHIRADRPFMLSMSEGASRDGAEAFASGARERALDKFREALRIDRSIDNRSGEMRDLVNIGRVYTALGRYVAAADFLNSAVRLGEVTKDEANLSEAYATFAKVEYLSGRTGPALDYMEESLQIDSRLGYKSGARLNLLGYIYIDCGRHAQAREVLGTALRINTDAGDTLEQANSYRALGDTSVAGGDAEEAFDYYEKAYRLDASAGVPDKIAHDLRKLAELNLKTGRRIKALFLFERYYVVSSNSGSRSNTMEALDRLISVCRELGDNEKALFYQGIKDGLDAAAFNY
ncbi:MAG: tetratricopeptide repeat protein [Thermodesulfobacteriota bacterium]